MTPELARTPLHDWHSQHGARMVDFAGWSMPVQYTSIVEEHRATRTAVGLFDISHMGRLRLVGPKALDFLDHLVTRRVGTMEVGHVRYALITNRQGGILDDVLVYHLHDPQGVPYGLVVVNASNREKIVRWIGEQLPADADLMLEDLTHQTAMIAVQGPRAVELVREALGVDVQPMRYYSAINTTLFEQPALVSRTGYTGEDGCELIVPAELALKTWQQLLSFGEPRQATAVGLGARDTLRLEAAMPLYGHELTEELDPFQAGLDFAVQLKDRDFIGADALRHLKHDPARPTRIGLQLEGRRVARERSHILRRDDLVGEVTSGTFSPTLGCPIAMGYVDPQIAASEKELLVDIRGRREVARVVQLPFYQRSSS